MSSRGGNSLGSFPSITSLNFFRISTIESRTSTNYFSLISINAATYASWSRFKPFFNCIKDNILSWPLPPSFAFKAYTKQDWLSSNTIRPPRYGIRATLAFRNKSIPRIKSKSSKGMQRRLQVPFHSPTCIGTYLAMPWIFWVLLLIALIQLVSSYNFNLSLATSLVATKLWVALLSTIVLTCTPFTIHAHAFGTFGWGSHHELHLEAGMDWLFEEPLIQILSYRL